MKRIRAMRAAFGALGPYGSQDSACPIDSNAGLSDARAAAWYALDCPPQFHCDADTAMRCASVAHGLWSLRYLFTADTWEG